MIDTPPELPPLPKPHEITSGNLALRRAFTADQMRAYAREAIAIDRLRDLASRADSPVGEPTEPMIDAYLASTETFSTFREAVRHSLRAALAASAVEAKPTAAEVTGEALESFYVRFAKEWITADDAARSDIKGWIEGWYEQDSASVSPSEAQKAVEPFGQVAFYPSRFPNQVARYEFYRWPQSPYLDNASECFVVYTHPSAGAGVPQEVARLREDARRWRALKWHWEDERDFGPGGRWWTAILIDKVPKVNTPETAIDAAMNPSSQEPK